MPVELPLIPSVPFYTFGVDLEDLTYLIEMRWNGRDLAWYMSIMEEDETPIRMGIKVVLGTFLGRRSVNPLFPPGLLAAVDLTGQGQDATLDDLGTRVVVYYYTAEEILTAT